MPRFVPSRPDPGGDPAYAALKARIIARTGHHYYIDKDELLAERLHRRFRATAIADCAAYSALLADRSRGEAEWANLEAEITVGETFFFRYAEQFQALRETILPALIAAHRHDRTLRIWSAGCSTGAEPYSLAILVREALGDALPDWRIVILGTDISVEALATARAAEYGRWALRTMPPEDRLRYFTRLPPAPGIRREGGFALRPEYRALVRFERGNLLSLVEPKVPPGEGFDLILCRNVLIYFEAETVAAVVRGLGRRLRPDGWMLLGHAEPNPTFSGFLDPVSLPGTVAYRRLADAVPTLAPRPVPPALEPAWSAPRIHEADEPDEPVESAVATILAPPRPAFLPSLDLGDGETPADDLARIRALADAGETGAAWRVLRDALARDPTDPALRFYEGLLARTLGRDVEAERALRAALYLDRGFVMAHYHLGLLLIALGRPEAAARALDNAIALSQALGPNTLLLEGDGAAAGEIAAGAAAARAGLGADGGTGRP
ncbi:chemotaxis protein methyltransferase CheR [Methylobacterium brachiatum]|uniref:protein-glutamate O-methyltransferase n=1 Tax=Methylobacterium brachiatum TaxID=269660 RepID=A0AAJ1TPK1_9HYPH|nr:CheR family methyltransferase [Methylobacterium brachiatum]MCB4801173.1 protein-glutamate methyltransferase [Methylobacterium brachiatum]MDQ0544625.1 chemotaxis protein methyltransferase CheR [Methylobacterium brachiatum]